MARQHVGGPPSRDAVAVQVQVRMPVHRQCNAAVQLQCTYGCGGSNCQPIWDVPLHAHTAQRTSAFIFLAPKNHTA